MTLAGMMVDTSEYLQNRKASVHMDRQSKVSINKCIERVGTAGDIETKK